MLVSWNWLKDYVALEMDPAELEHRLSMAGLNHESTRPVADDLVVDLEVTSNRPDWLGHVGVAREISVLWDQPLQVPNPQPKSIATPASEAAKITLQCAELCPRYTARVIRGVKIKPSPDWLARRLESIGIAVINNVVDITNYVLMETGQPLHAFDLARLRGQQIIVRRAVQGEPFEAIDHTTYELQEGMCVIADRDRPVALGGVMGGVDSEVGDGTVDLLVEAAEFDPLSIRSTSRTLKLFSPSSYRFERGVDPQGVDWASRRCCELILELAGGELLSGMLDSGTGGSPPPTVTLRLGQLQRILGISVDADEVARILSSLGCERQADGAAPSESAPSITVRPPSWRRDLTREIDLVEEVARVHGYDEIPEDVGVPMAPSHRTDQDRVLAMTRATLTAAGFDEAMTTSVVPSQWEDAFSPWTDQPPIQCNTPMLKGASLMRRSLVPSLLEARRINQSLSNPEIELFETARVYLSQVEGLPVEQKTLAICSGRDFRTVKGVVEALLSALKIETPLAAVDTRQSLLDSQSACQLELGSQRLGFLGAVTAAGQKQFQLRSATIVAELDLGVLAAAANLVPQYQPASAYPAIARDMNLIVDERVRWSELAQTVRNSAGEFLESMEYQETYRDPKRDGSGKKRTLFSITLRSAERTMTGEEADAIRDAVEQACSKEHGAELVRS